MRKIMKKENKKKKKKLEAWKKYTEYKIIQK